MQTLEVLLGLIIANLKVSSEPRTERGEEVGIETSWCLETYSQHV